MGSIATRGQINGSPAYRGSGLRSAGENDYEKNVDDC